MVPGADFAKSTDGEHSRLVVVASDGELSLTRTGNNLIAGLAPPSRPARYSLRQPKTWLALTPCARATRATDAPSTNVSSTIRRFSAMLRCCRVGAPNDSLLAVITSRTCREVSISAPSAHHSVSVHFTRMALNYGDVQTVTTGRLLER